MKFQLENMLGLDIETVPRHKTLEILKRENPRMAKNWEVKHARKYSKEGYYVSDLSYENNAPLHPEYAVICCISMQRLDNFGPETVVSHHLEDNNTLTIEDQEKRLLEKFLETWDIATNPSRSGELRISSMLAHNGIGFDYPFIAKRLMAHELPVPDILRTAGKKPWEVSQTLMDTNILWKMCGWSGASLDEVAHTLRLESSKDALDGSMVSSTFWDKGDIESIVKYCEEDVMILNQVMRAIAETYN